MSRETDSAFSSRRRDLMKAVGAGAVLTTLGGSAVAQTDDDATETDDGMDGGEGNGEYGGTETTTAHQVEMLIRGPPTNPERPADFFYQPTGLHVQPGDVVKFVATTPDHNVVSYHPAFGMRRRVPTGVPAISSPLLGWRPASIAGDQIEPPAEMGGAGPGGDGQGTETGPGSGEAPTPETWLYAFEEPGVYDLLCSPHEVYGMAMRVVVGDDPDAPFGTEDPDALPEPRAGPAELARETLTDPALAPSAIVEAEAVAWGDLDATQQASETETTTADGG